MNVKQRFNKTIQEIEKRAGDPYVDSQELAADIAASNALVLRDMITVFKYLTGNTLRAYILSIRKRAFITKALDFCAFHAFCPEE